MNTDQTLELLKYLLKLAEAEGKRALLINWDKASWHKSKQVRAGIQGHNRKVKPEGGVRRLTYLLPSKSPWLNPQEPPGVHCQKSVVEPAEVLTPRQLKEGIRDYFRSDPPTE